MLYKHWKKIALARTGFFWASCDDSASSSEVVLYGCPDDICAPAPKSSSDANDTQSSSSAPSTSSGTEISSSSLEKHNMPLYGVSEMVLESSSSTEESSSSMEIPVPAYGVFGAMACYEDASSKVTQGQTTKTTYRCDDGVTCQEKVSERWAPEYNCVEDICPDYGVVSITEKTYTCDDGNTYNYAEFISRYSKVDVSEEAQGK